MHLTELNKIAIIGRILYQFVLVSPVLIHQTKLCQIKTIISSIFK